MAKSSKRTYQSSMRQQQADETRQRIVDAARALFLATGYDETTIEAIAAEAGVAAQTIYAVFRSKRGILAAIIDRARFGPLYQESVRRAKATTEPVARIRLIAQITRQISDAERAEVMLLRGAGMVAPELAQLGQTAESGRFAVHAANVKLLADAGRLRADLDIAKAQDILWALTGRELYTMLVVERAWSADDYEQWLANLLITALLSADAPLDKIFPAE